MQIWHELKYVAKYAFCVLFLGLKIFICAILYAFSISGDDDGVDHGRDHGNDDIPGSSNSS